MSNLNDAIGLLIRFILRVRGAVTDAQADGVVQVAHFSISPMEMPPGVRGLNRSGRVGVHTYHGLP